MAYQTALQARRAAARRREREKQVTALPEPAVVDRDRGRDLHLQLHQELSRLPDAYREAIVLSDLEGKPRGNRPPPRTARGTVEPAGEGRRCWPGSCRGVA